MAVNVLRGFDVESLLPLQITIDEEGKALKIASANAETTLAARDAVKSFLQQMRKEMKDIHVDDQLIGPLIGRGGANLKKLQVLD